MRVLTIAMLLIFLMGNVQASQEDKAVPPLPTEDPHAIEMVIITMKTKAKEEQIQSLLKKYPRVKLRHVFSEAIQGFSIEGEHEQLARLKKEEWVETFSPVQQYETEVLSPGKKVSFEDQGNFSGNHNRVVDSKRRLLTGRGVTVGVIDTGIDYTHPDLRKNYLGGRDFIDLDEDPMESKGDAGFSTLHGTHVAGIIAANGKMRGIAPEAKIKAYRALGPGGKGTTEQVLAAIEQAIKDKVDILNLSLGNGINGPDLPLAIALNSVVDKGITAVVASGNSGPRQWTVGAPGTAAKAISVGASTPVTKVPYIIIEGTREKFRVDAMGGSAEWRTTPSFELADGGYGTEQELLQSKNKIALIKRGKLTFAQKAQNAVKAGARGAIIYNNKSGSFMGNLGSQLSIPVASAPMAAGEAVLRGIKAGKNSARVLFFEESRRMAPFSSRGPVTGSLAIKPDLVAPGVNISSTIPGGYLQLSGTSMAAPYVAGTCALIKQARPDWGPIEIKAALMNSALPVGGTNGGGYKTFEQGAGRVLPEKAVQLDVLVMPGSLSFGKMPKTFWKTSDKRNLTIKNTGDQSVRIGFAIPAMQPGLSWKMPLPFYLKAGEQRTVAITLRIDGDELKGKMADGTLLIHAGSSKIKLPYNFAFAEPDYPRVMGFSFADGDGPGKYMYEVYLPGGADEFGIALFRKADYRFAGYLDYGRGIDRGMIRKSIDEDKLPEPGTYSAKVFARKAGREDMVETTIKINPAP
ncbi:peptidase S8 [Bacillus sp. FJAT-27225]|uniref:S8 family serine peptidase n=1 Tax=Bacillus sp. FJAT-27225 TaxID=1743144 RepID=UPI00080C3398|nr:S8 family serine peptidase [Bacillus sp. FJAT-27225]OCA82393.1 peptidase S8 [Bacillus sp. FJAT-27225]